VFKDAQLHQAAREAKEFASLGPLKSHVTRLEDQISSQVEELTQVKLTNEELKAKIKEECAKSDLASLDLQKC
jgi:regulator of replication initiation timing